MLALFGVIILFIWATVNFEGIASEPAPPVVLNTLVVMILGFVLVGITVLQTETYPRLVVFLLITEAVALIFVFTGPALFQGDPPNWFGAFIEGFQSLLLFGIGTTLRGHTPHEGTGTAAGTTAR